MVPVRGVFPEGAVYHYGYNARDAFNDVIATSDGYIAVGWTEAYTYTDVLYIKTDKNGNLVWMKHLGENNIEGGYCIRPLGDGNYLISARTKMVGSSNGDIWLIAINSNGDTLWTKTFGGDDYEGIVLGNLLIDGDYAYIAGFTYSYTYGDRDGYFVKFDLENKEVVYEKHFGTNSFDMLGNFVKTDDGGFLLVGSTEQNGNRDIWLLKLDSNGDSVWARTFGSDEFDDGVRIKRFGENYLILGTTRRVPSKGSDIYLLVVDENGDSLWAKQYGGNQFELAWDVLIQGDTIGICGGSKSLESSDDTTSIDAYVIWLNSDGDSLGGTVFGSPGKWDGANALIYDNGAYIVTGETNTWWDDKLMEGFLWRPMGPPTQIAEQNSTPPIQLRLLGNPAREFALEMEIKNAGFVDVGLYNVIGQRVSTIFKGFRGKGAFRIEKKLKLRRGIYLIRVATPTTTSTKKSGYLLNVLGAAGEIPPPPIYQPPNESIS